MKIKKIMLCISTMLISLFAVFLFNNSAFAAVRTNYFDIYNKSTSLPINKNNLNNRVTNSENQGVVYLTIDDVNHVQFFDKYSISVHYKYPLYNNDYIYNKYWDVQKNIEQTQDGWKITISGLNWDSNISEYYILLSTNKYFYYKKILKSQNGSTIPLSIDSNYFTPNVSLPFTNADFKEKWLILTIADEKGKGIGECNIYNESQIMIPKAQYHAQFLGIDKNNSGYNLLKMYNNLSKDNPNIVFNKNEIAEVKTNLVTDKNLRVSAMCPLYFHGEFSSLTHLSHYDKSIVYKNFYITKLNYDTIIFTVETEDDWEYDYGTPKFNATNITSKTFNISTNLTSKVTLKKQSYFLGEYLSGDTFGVYDDYQNKVRYILSPEDNYINGTIEFVDNKGQSTIFEDISLNYPRIEIPDTFSGTYDVAFKVEGGPIEIKSLSTKINIGEGSSITIPVSSITLNKTSINIGLNKPIKLEYKINPTNATNKNVTWSSSDESIVTVDENGNVTGLSEGTATILVTTEDGNKTASCTVKVVPVNQIKLDKSDISIKPGAKASLKAVISPNEAVNKNVIWSSSDESIVTVDDKGNITALKEGKATIKARSEENESIFAECNVTVEIPVSSIKLNASKINLSTSEGYNTFKLVANFMPDNATNKNITWASSDENVATVDESGNVTALKEGTAVIKATTESGAKAAQCIVTVATVKEIKLNKTQIDMNVGQAFSLNVKTNPVNAPVKDVVFESSDEEKVIVTPFGKLIAVAATDSPVTITVTSKDNPEVFATCTVTVKLAKEDVKVADIILTNVKTGKIEGLLQVGKSGNIKAMVIGENKKTPTNKNIIWESSDTNVITVDDNGKVTAKSPGTAEIIAKAVDGSGTSKTITIEVVQPITNLTIEKKITISAGEEKEIIATLLPDNVTIDGIKVEWNCSDKNGKFITFNGYNDVYYDEELGRYVVKADITGVAKGIANINLKVTTKDGSSKTVNSSIVVTQ